MATTPRQRNIQCTRIFETASERDDDVGLSIGATTYSKPVAGPKLNGIISVGLHWTANVTGTLSVQYTLKPNPELTTDADWITATVTVVGDAFTIAGSAGKCVATVTLPTLCEWFRVKYAHNAGSPSVFNGYARAS